MDRFLLQLQGLIDVPKPHWLRIAAILLAIAAVSGLRWVIDRGENGFSFSPYFPAILISSVLYGWRYGLFAATVSLAVVIGLFIDPGWIERSLVMRLMLLSLFALTIGIILSVSEGLRRLLAETKRRADTVETWNDELRHRTGNLLQVLVNWIERGLIDGDPRSYFERLSGQLVAWSRSNEMLRATVRETFALDDLVELALQPFPQGRFQIDGPEVELDGDRARAVAVALHELATNSVKYGALAVDDGYASVVWRVEGAAVRLHWLEESRGRAAPAAGSGFGLALLAALRDIEDLEYDFAPDGLRCAFAVRWRR